MLQKLPHLLASDTMHNLNTQDNANNWYNYNGELVQGIDTLIQQFFHSLLGRNEDLPTYATLIAHLNTNKGGLGILNASLRAAPDFVLTTMMSKRRAIQGFETNKELLPTTLHQSIQELYTLNTNNQSSAYYGTTIYYPHSQNSAALINVRLMKLSHDSRIIHPYTALEAE
jgi:hypothetical protein